MFDQISEQQNGDECGLNLNILIHNSDPFVRGEAAKFGGDQELDILVHDTSSFVRTIVADRGRDKDLDILVKDSSSTVRMAVASCGRDKDLDILVHDDISSVREAVARYGRDKDLDILVHDKKLQVRKAVAAHERDKDLNILSKDPNFFYLQFRQDKSSIVPETSNVFENNNTKEQYDQEEKSEFMQHLENVIDLSQKLNHEAMEKSAEKNKNAEYIH